MEILGIILIIVILLVIVGVIIFMFFKDQAMGMLGKIPLIGSLIAPKFTTSFCGGDMPCCCGKKCQ